MTDTPKRPIILVLEDEIKWQSIITGVSDNMGFDCELISSITEFKEKFKKDAYKAVILDNQVDDGEALLRCDLAQWVRKEDQNVPMALNSLSEVWQLAKEVGACNLNKNPMRLRDFLHKIQ